MGWVEVPALDLPVQAGLLAVLLRLVVLLALFEQSMGGIVMRVGFAWVEWVRGWFWFDAVA